jgi:hypothetical protein
MACDGCPCGDFPCDLGNPSIKVEKYVDLDHNQPGSSWEDADTSSTAAEGSYCITFKIVVTNTGDVPLSNVTLSDSDPLIQVSAPTNYLDVGASFEVLSDEISKPPGEYVNTATAEGEHEGMICQDSDDAYYNVIRPDNPAEGYPY